jgi:hypothetical protein
MTDSLLTDRAGFATAARKSAEIERPRKSLPFRVDPPNPDAESGGSMPNPDAESGCRIRMPNPS